MEKITALNQYFTHDPTPLIFENIYWPKAQLPSICFPNQTTWKNCRLPYSNFYNAKKRDNTIENVTYRSSHLMDANFDGSTMTNVSFRFANIMGISMEDVKKVGSIRTLGAKKKKFWLQKVLDNNPWLRSLTSGISIEKRHY